MSFSLGTDGWRGVIADGCTFEAVRRVAASMARLYAGNVWPGDRSRIVVGHDTRFFSPEFARAAAVVFARAGIDVLLTDRPIPTPAVSHHVRRLGLAAGVAITASHNPAHWNGFKIKASFGGSAPPEQYAEVDRGLSRGNPAPEARRPGAIETADLATPYREHLASLLDVSAIKEAGLILLADAMHGAGGTLIADIAGGGRTRVVSFRGERDVLFGGVQPEPIARNLAASAARVVELRAGLAVANDGDADRLGVLDRRGRFVSPHRVLALLLVHAFRRRGLKGGIAKTFSTSLLIDRVAKALGCPLVETSIGFKYIAERMMRGEASAGGEESGGYAFAFHLPERDGVLNALLLIESLALSGRDLDGALADLAREFGEFAYDRRDVSLPVGVIGEFLAAVKDHAPGTVSGNRVTGIEGKDGIKYVLGDRGWLLHRLSGTEPMIRLYCEHEDEAAVQRILDEAHARLVAFAASRGATPGAHG
ncbi:MAG TPA: phosphoglucomutase/phosphomannomutase family protein [Thermoanaerobaculia bacterium]|nr:phosphoglucomutase/phosphomannomutase family protein [Thermoanaerobaculia bacterium]